MHSIELHQHNSIERTINKCSVDNIARARSSIRRLMRARALIGTIFAFELLFIVIPLKWTQWCADQHNVESHWRRLLKRLCARRFVTKLSKIDASAGLFMVYQSVYGQNNVITALWHFAVFALFCILSCHSRILSIFLDGVRLRPCSPIACLCLSPIWHHFRWIFG